MSTLHSSAAARRAGLTYRMIDYWARCGAIEPSGGVAAGSGTRRVWTTFDVDRLVVLGRLRGLLGDLTLDLVRTVWRWLGRRETWPDFVTVVRAGGRWYVHPGADRAEGAAIVVPVGPRTVEPAALLDEPPLPFVVDTAPL